MLHNVDLILTLAGGLSAALVLGFITQKLRMSPIVGYLLAGIIVGPYSPGFVADADTASQCAEIGIILLMFTLGLEFSIDDTGLFATIQINPDDTDALSLRARVLRGDVDQASFGFEESSVEYTDLPDGRVRRTIRKISKLWEVSVCTFPAYEQTYVSARSASGDALRRSVLEHRKTKLKRRLKHHGKQ